MEVILVILIICFVGFIWWKTSTSYENKVNSEINSFKSKISKYQDLFDLNFIVQTSGRKIQTWDKQHKIDFIINRNKDDIIRTLMLYNEYVKWWKTNKDEISKQVIAEVNNISKDMIVFGNSYRKRMDGEIANLLKVFDIESISYRLSTYTVHSNSRHYNPRTHEWWNDYSNEEMTFSIKLSPDDVRMRIEVLAKYNYEMTEYEYNCENQRKLMTKELRREIIERDHGICQICRKKCKDEEIEIDHIKPVSKGGKTIKSNLQVLCFNCNRSKSNKYLGELRTIGFNENNSIQKEYNNTGDEFDRKNNKTKFNKVVQNCGIKVGDNIVIEYLSSHKQLSLRLVEEFEGNLKGCVSKFSPIGQAIYGLEEGDVINVNTPNGIETIKIIEVNHIE